MSEYYAVQRSTDHLAHYGVKGMKWGVRRAIANANARSLDRHFRRAARKLKKLTDIGMNSKKYAIKAAAYGAAAAGTGTVAALGTKGYSNILRNKAKKLLAGRLRAEVASMPGQRLVTGPGPYTFKSEAAKNLTKEAHKLTDKADRIDAWGDYRKSYTPVEMKSRRHPITGRTEHQLVTGETQYTGLSRNQKLRIGAAAATAGLTAMSALNAYRASHPQKYRQKAMEFKNAMDDIFAGTKYAGKYVAEPKPRKKRKRK